MRLAILTSLMLSVLLAATGCSVSGQAVRHSSSMPSSNVADVSSDPSWTPPGEMDLAIGDAKTSDARPTVAESMPQPNRREILRRQLRAAAY
jgi:hypothetical protein